MAIILKANKVNLFVSSVLLVFWYHSPNVLDTLHTCDISRLRVKDVYSTEHQRLGAILVSVVICGNETFSVTFRTRSSTLFGNKNYQ
jgi:hypothetical protein